MANSYVHVVPVNPQRNVVLLARVGPESQLKNVVLQKKNSFINERRSR